MCLGYFFLNQNLQTIQFVTHFYLNRIYISKVLHYFNDNYIKLGCFFLCQF